MIKWKSETLNHVSQSGTVFHFFLSELRSTRVKTHSEKVKKKHSERITTKAGTYS